MQNSGQLLLLAVLVVFVVWTFSRGRRQQRETMATQARVRPGAEVMMTSGIYGTVVEVTDDGIVRLETSPGTVSRWNRRAIARVVSAPDEPAASEAGAESATAADPAVEPVEPGVEPVEPVRPVQDSAPPDRD